MLLDDNDRQSLALCAWKEARGEGLDGLRAVLHVILNRVAALMCATVHEAIYAKNQFTSMSVPSDPQFNLEPVPPDVRWQQAKHMAASIENDPDNTNGAKYYANLATMDEGGWFARNIVADTVAHPQVAVIGHHHFYL